MMKNVCLNECMKEGLKKYGKWRFLPLLVVCTECAQVN